MAKYVKLEHLLSYLKDARQNRKVNISPYMDNALLNVIQLLELDPDTPFFDFVDIGNCDGCEWKKSRHQKCSCCRRNQNMKDLYRRNDNDGLL